MGRCLGVFYADDGMVGSRNSDWLQHTMNVLVRIFRSYGLVANIEKSRTMTCQPGSLRTGMSEEAMPLKCTGVGDSYRLRLRRRIPCLECGVELTAGSIMVHCRRMHGTEPAIDGSRLPFIQTVHQPQVYDVSFPRTTEQCPFPGCQGSSRTWNGLRSHFNRQN